MNSSQRITNLDFIRVLQIYWSKPILEKWRYGPLEWFWRKLTYLFI